MTVVDLVAAQYHAGFEDLLEGTALYTGVFSLPMHRAFGRTASEEVYGVVGPRIPMGHSPAAPRAYRCGCHATGEHVLQLQVTKLPSHVRKVSARALQVGMPPGRFSFYIQSTLCTRIVVCRVRDRCRLVLLLVSGLLYCSLEREQPGCGEWPLSNVEPPGFADTTNSHPLFGRRTSFEGCENL